MHIIFFILKLIGIILASIIGLILLLLLTILLVPIRYRVFAEQEEDFHAEAKVSWLMRIIHLRINFMDNHLLIILRIFGRVFYNSDLANKDNGETKVKRSNHDNNKTRSDRKKLKKKALNKSSKTKRNKSKETIEIENGSKVIEKSTTTDGVLKRNGTNPIIKNENAILKEEETKIKDTSSKITENSKELISKETVIKTEEKIKIEEKIKAEEKLNVEENDKIEETVKIKEEIGIEEKIITDVIPLKSESDKIVKINLQNDNTEDDEGQDIKKSNKITKIFLKIKNFFINLKNSFVKIKDSIFNINDKLHQIKEKWYKIKAFIKDEINKAGLSRSLKSLLNILKHIRPKKLQVNLQFGTGDPCSTGQVLGVLSVFYGYYGKSIQLIPNFNESVLKGTIFCIGRIRLLTLLIICIKLILDKKFKQLLNNFKVLKEEL